MTEYATKTTHFLRCFEGVLPVYTVLHHVMALEIAWMDLTFALYRRAGPSPVPLALAGTAACHCSITRLALLFTRLLVVVWCRTA